MLPHDKALALSATDTELLRDLRSRLNRMASAAPAVAAKSVAPLSRGFFDVCARVGLTLAADEGQGFQALQARDGAKGWMSRAADRADISELRILIAGLHRLHREPARWSEVLGEGVLQAVISRRLALAGREPAKESEIA